MNLFGVTCQNVTSLDNLKQTDFVITLENPISENKNIIYAPAFLYAWDKIKEELKSQYYLTAQTLLILTF
ncbi:MAG: hypothetical protein IPM95_10660 [Sphingobacteriales bacterium]|nr:hypothetical protein [Sphingobacteriales bacterium]